jgi:hypothetical protein
MEDDRTRAFRKSTSSNEPDPADAARAAAQPEWHGTGLCTIAQADGVPCVEAGRSCDICARASKELLPAEAGPQPAREEGKSREDDKPEGPFLLERAGL